MNAPPIQLEVSQGIFNELKRSVIGDYRLSEVWSDWILIVEATLRMLPVHAESVQRTGLLAQDPPDIAVEWSRLAAKYGGRFQHLVHAYNWLLKIAEPIGGGDAEICDILGPLYMELGNPNKGVGQEFTPWCMCTIMAKTTVADAPAEVYRRMEQALREHPIHSLLVPEREGWINAENGRWIAENMLPWQHFEPIKIHDPCVGSGGMMLAAAAEFPRWMLTLGMVQFFGQDISRDCTLMTSINMMLFGLNGWGMRYQIAGQQLLPMLPASPILSKPHLAEPDYMVGAQGSLFDMTHTG